MPVLSYRTRQMLDLPATVDPADITDALRHAHALVDGDAWTCGDIARMSVQESEELAAELAAETATPMEQALADFINALSPRR